MRGAVLSALRLQPASARTSGCAPLGSSPRPGEGGRCCRGGLFTAQTCLPSAPPDRKEGLWPERPNSALWAAGSSLAPSPRPLGGRGSGSPGYGEVSGPTTPFLSGPADLRVACIAGGLPLSHQMFHLPSLCYKTCCVSWLLPYLLRAVSGLAETLCPRVKSSVLSTK